MKAKSLTPQCVTVPIQVLPGTLAAVPHLEGYGQQGQVDVLPAEGVQQGGCSVHCSRHCVPFFGHKDDTPLQQQSGKQRHQALHGHIPQQAR